MSLLTHWRRRRARNRLSDTRFDFLFDDPPAGEYVSLDCETTSLDPKSAELLSIAAVRVCGRRVVLSDSLTLIVRPEGRIDPRTIPIHRLRTQDVAEGVDPRAAMERLLDFVGPRPVIGYYLEFDMAVIDRHIKSWLGTGLPNERVEVSGLYYDRYVSAYRPEVDLSLQAILDKLDLPRLPPHDPLNDAVTAALVWLKLTQVEGG